MEAAEVLGSKGLLPRIKEVALRMVYATLARGLDADGEMSEEGNLSRVLNFTKVWWVQAKAMVGFLNANQLSGDPRSLLLTLAQ
jgi:mannobiose 2-epimerase